MEALNRKWGRASRKKIRDTLATLPVLKVPGGISPDDVEAANKERDERMNDTNSAGADLRVEVKRLWISKVKGLITVVPPSRRRPGQAANKLAGVGLSIMPSLDKQSFSVAQLSMLDESTTVRGLQKYITKFYLQQIWRVALNVVFSLGIVGNPAAVVGGFGAGIKAALHADVEAAHSFSRGRIRDCSGHVLRGGAELFENSGRGLATGASSLFLALSNCMDTCCGCVRCRGNVGISSPTRWAGNFLNDVALTLDSAVLSEYRVRPPRVLSKDACTANYDYLAASVMEIDMELQATASATSFGAMQGIYVEHGLVFEFQGTSKGISQNVKLDKNPAQHTLKAFLVLVTAAMLKVIRVSRTGREPVIGEEIVQQMELSSVVEATLDPKQKPYRRLVVRADDGATVTIVGEDSLVLERLNKALDGEFK